MVAGPIVGEAIGGLRTPAYVRADDVEPDIVTSGGPPLDAPCPNPWWGEAQEKKNVAIIPGNSSIVAIVRIRTDPDPDD